MSAPASHDVKTFGLVDGNFQFLVLNFSGVCKMALEGRLKRVQAGTAVHAAEISVHVHVYNEIHVLVFL